MTTAYRVRFLALLSISFLILAAAGTARAQDFSVNNYAQAADPYDPGTVFLGDTNVTFGCTAWANIDGNWGGIQIWIDSDSNVQDGTAGADFFYANVEDRVNTSAQFRSVGTWYWAVLMRYNTGSGDTYGWYYYDTDGVWVGEEDPPGAAIPVTVNALNPPSNQDATAASSSQIDLTWDRGVSGSAKDTLIFRYTNNVPPTPVGGTTYNAGNDYVFGGKTYRAVYRGSGTSHPDAGLQPDQEYHYYFFAENWTYYSSGVTASDTTPNTTTNNAVWDGGGGTSGGNWNTLANWVDDKKPATGSDSTNHFAGTTQTTVTNDFPAGTQFDSIFFDASAWPFVILGNSFKIDSKIENNSGETQWITNHITLNGAGSTEINPVNADIDLDGDVTLDGTELEVWGDSSGVLAIHGDLTDGSGAGSVALKQFSYLLYLNTDKSYTGNTTIEDGILLFNGVTAPNTLINLGALSGAKGAIITLSDTSIPNTIFVRGGSSGSKLLTSGVGVNPVSTYNGTVYLNDSVLLRQESGGTTEFAELEDGTEPGAHTIEITQNTVRFIGSASNGDDNEGIAGYLVSGGTLELAKDQGLNAISSTLTIDASASVQLLNSNQMADAVSVVMNGGTFDLNGHNEEIGDISGSGSVTLGDAQLITGGNGNTTALAADVSGVGGSLVKKGGGVMEIDGALSYTGPTYPVGGDLSINTQPDAGFTGQIYLGETFGADAATLDIGADGVDLSNGITVRSGSSGTAKLSASDSAGVGTFSGDIDLQKDVTLEANSGSQLTLSGAITNNGHSAIVNAAAGNQVNLAGAMEGIGALIVRGGGTGAVAAAQTYTGNTEIDEGTLLIDSGGDLSDSSDTYIGNGLLGYANANADLALTDGADLGGDVYVNTSQGTGTRTLRLANGSAALSGGNLQLSHSLDVALDAGVGESLIIDNFVDLSWSSADSLNVSGTSDLTLNGAIAAVTGGSEINMTGTGTLSLFGNSAQGFNQMKINLGGGTLAVTNGNAFGDVPGGLYSDKINFYGISPTLSALDDVSLDGNFGITVDNTAARFDVANGKTLTVNGPIANGALNGAVTKAGTGTMVYNGTSSYANQTTVEGGTLQVDGDITSSSSVSVDNTGTLAGTGTVSSMTLFGTLSPGASVGALNAGATTWKTNSVYDFEINDFGGTQGSDPGWDLLNVGGALTIEATSGQEMTINVISLNGSSPGAAANFINTQGYTQTVAVCTSFAGFNPTDFTINPAGFQNPTGAGAWSMEVNGLDIDLVFTPGFEEPFDGTLVMIR